MSIPLVDLKAQLRTVESDVREGWDRVLSNTAFILGKEVADFEQEFAKFCQLPHAVGVGNGTDAIELAVRALGLGQDDEVILPANTFIATALGVRRAGAKPVLVDCDPVFHLIDPDATAAAVTPKTRALMPVHLYGQAAPMTPLMNIAKEHDLLVLEDAAQAHGATQDGTPVGGWGAAAGFSFYPGKNLGAFGDAGAVATQHEHVATKIRALRNYGSEVKYHHPEPGFNSRLDAVQAVVLRAKLKHLASWNDQRRERAERYRALLADVDGVVLPETAAKNRHVWHLFVVRVPDRDKTLAALNAQGIGAGIHYPIPIHLQGAFTDLGKKEGSFPVAEKASKEILSLPLFPELSDAQQDRVVEVLKQNL